MNEELKSASAPLSPAEFAVLGGRVAYVKPMSSEEIIALYPQAPELEPGLQLFALLGADGQPILLADSREAAIANAMSQEIETVSVH